MKPEMISIPYKKNIAINIFKKISHKMWSMLLHSGKSYHKYNRFDIIVSDPSITLITKNNITKIKSKNRNITSTRNPFDLVKEEIKNININYAFNNDIPFQGGALGIWGYDLIRYIEKIPKISENKLYCPDMAIGIYLWSLIVDHKKEIVTLISNKDIKKRYKWLKKHEKIKSDNFQILKSWKSNMTKEEYYYKFEKIQKHLKNGNCYQVNLSQRFQNKYIGNEFDAFLTLNKQNKAPFSSFIRLEKNCIISLSPERFISLKKHNIQTRPIKGSIKRIKNHNEDKKQIKLLKSSKKNLAENIMIVDLMRNDIGKIAIPGSIKVSKLCSVESFKSIHHMVSSIIGKLPKKYHALDLLKTCFPGGSITGAPKIASIKIIEKLEPQRRHTYCGSIGYISFCGTMDTNINIRSLLTENKNIYCWGGGGIIYDSLKKEEYKEIFYKLSKILPFLKKK